jgi:hypothetical protein
VNQISLFECHGDVAVCMRRAVVLQRQGRVVVVEAVYVTEGRRGEGLWRRRRKRVAPVVDASRSG